MCVMLVARRNSRLPCTPRFVRTRCLYIRAHRRRNGENQNEQDAVDKTGRGSPGHCIHGFRDSIPLRLQAQFCENLLNLESALWTFTRVEGVEPTNNYMERLVRLAVLWRRRSFGCNSVVGCRFVERILTVVQTCRLRNRNTIEYLREAVSAHRAGKPCPALLADC